MKKSAQKRGWIFAGKSLLWSLLLYVALMLCVNWDEVSCVLSGNKNITLVNGAKAEGPVAPAGIARHTGLVNDVVALAKIVGGFARVSSK